MKRIEILGPGCAKCRKLVENVERAVAELGSGYEVVKVTDIGEIMKYDVMMTPALVVDGAVKSSGSSLSVAKVKEFLSGD